MVPAILVPERILGERKNGKNNMYSNFFGA
jgi:hypothetical protein